MIEVRNLTKSYRVKAGRHYVFRGVTPEMHAQWMQEAGFAEVEILWRDERRACFAAFK
jgi:hypothetical protein